MSKGLFWWNQVQQHHQSKSLQSVKRQALFSGKGSNVSVCYVWYSEEMTVWNLEEITELKKAFNF